MGVRLFAPQVHRSSALYADEMPGYGLPPERVMPITMEGRILSVRKIQIGEEN
jgi:hypothetical protein